MAPGITHRKHVLQVGPRARRLCRLMLQRGRCKSPKAQKMDATTQCHTHPMQSLARVWQLQLLSYTSPILYVLTGGQTMV